MQLFSDIHTSPRPVTGSSSKKQVTEILFPASALLDKRPWNPFWIVARTSEAGFKTSTMSLLLRLIQFVRLEARVTHAA